MSKTNKRRIKLNMNIDSNDNTTQKCGIPEDNTSAPFDSNDSIVLNVINELNDLIIAKRDFIVESFATKRGPIGRPQIKDYLNQMTEIVTNKRNQILGSTSSTALNATKVECNPNENSNNSHLNSISNISEVFDNDCSDKTSAKVTKTKTKTKSKSIQKSTKRKKSVGRKGIGKLLFDYRNRNRIPDYQKRLKYVEKDPNIEILHKKIGLVSTRLSNISECSQEF